jgi:amino acid transporter
MGAIVLVLTWACATGIITTASRMTWSFARDRGTPFGKLISYVSPNRRIPVVGIIVVTSLAALLTLIYIGSPTAFNDVISLTITGFYCSYFLPAAFLLYHRIKGHVLPHKQDTPGIPLGEEDVDAISGPSEKQAIPKDEPDYKSSPDGDRTADVTTIEPPDHDHHASVVQAQLIWGPWHIPGIFGIINNAYACVYMIFVIFWSVWPPETPVTYQTMNYSIVVTAGVVIFSIVWYYIRGRKEYKGPLIDDEVAAVMRLGSVVHV